MTDAARNAVEDAIQKNGGWLAFDEFLTHAQHHPRYGYYGSGRVQFGASGDFYTAPTMSPLFGATLAQQLPPILQDGNGILELGGGDGHLAEHILTALAATGQRPPYAILETSAQLRQRQQQRLQAHPQVQWLDRLPDAHRGIIIANEVLDCVPFRIFHKQNGDWLERGVCRENGELTWAERPPDDDAWRVLGDLPLADGYQSEVSPQAEALTRTLTTRLQYGYLLLIDYGFGAAEYYHPQRRQGTFRCHRAQQVDDNPFIDIGDKDITTHINFTAIAQAGMDGGAQLCGYTTQAHFLINGGILELLQTQLGDDERYARLAAGVNKLLAPHEMGELFKCMTFSKGDVPPVAAFGKDDMSHRL